MCDLEIPICDLEIPTQHPHYYYIRKIRQIVDNVQMIKLLKEIIYSDLFWIPIYNEEDRYIIRYDESLIQQILNDSNFNISHIDRDDFLNDIYTPLLLLTEFYIDGNLLINDISRIIQNSLPDT